MAHGFDHDHDGGSDVIGHGGRGVAPGKAALTQRMTRATATTPPVTPPIQRQLDPVAAAIQRRAADHAMAAAFGFFGGPAESMDASNARLVQRQADAHTGLDDGAIAAHAARGVSGGGGALPHLAVIQRAFGPDHDLSGVRAHVGGAAAEASAAIGAHAYATGNDIAFAAQPDLFLAAHEATHIVQQRQGVSLKGAVGQDGDRYEQHADQVAAAVVRGDSVAELLEAAPGGAAPRAQRLTTSIRSPQYLRRVTLDGSAYLCAGANATPSYEKQFGGTGTSTAPIPDGYRGLVRIHVDGTAEISALTGIYFTPLDLIAIWNVEYKDDKLSLRWDPSLLSSLDNEVVLDVAPDQYTDAYAGHPGFVTLKVTPRRPSSLGDQPINLGAFTVNVGDSALPPLEFKVQLPVQGKDPSLKPPIPTPPPEHAIRTLPSKPTPVKDDCPPLPGDLAYGYQVRFKKEGDTTPTPAETKFLDIFLADVDAFNASLVAADKPTIEHWYKLRVTGHASNTAKPEIDRAKALERARWVREYVATDLGLVIDTDAVVASKGHKESERADAEAAEAGAARDASADFVDKRAVLEFIRK